MTEDRLREALHRAVPEAPPIEFAPRYRPVLVPVLAAVLVLLVAVPLALLLRRDDAARPVAPVPSPGRFTCGPHVDLDTNATAVPEGAVAVGLCNVPGGHDFQVPAEQLARGVPALVDYVNALPDRPSSMGCRADPGINFRLVFTYPDGSRFFVDASYRGCRDVWVGRRRAAGGPQLWQRILGAFRAQRGSFQLGVPDGLVAPSCASAAKAQPSPVASPRELAVGRLCTWHGFTEEPRSDRALTQEELVEVVEGLHSVEEPPLGSSCEALGPVPEVVIIGLTGRGELVRLRTGCEMGSVLRGDLSGALWAPDEEGRAVIMGASTP